MKELSNTVCKQKGGRMCLWQEIHPTPYCQVKTCNTRPQLSTTYDLKKVLHREWTKCMH